MHEAFKKRLQAIEEARKLQHEAAQSIFIEFPDASWEITCASGPCDFICRRDPGEPRDHFEIRTDHEFRSAFPNWGLPAVFVLGQNRDSSTKSTQ
jgi:hypothetical protein